MKLCSLTLVVLQNKKAPNHKFGAFRDLDWIQTSNLLSRNQVRYSVAPRGLLLFTIMIITTLIAGANIRINVFIIPIKITLCHKLLH